MVHIYTKRKRHSHRSAYSGGGTQAGHEGTGSVAGIEGVHLNDHREVKTIQPVEAPSPMVLPKIEDPYARKCDFTNLKVLSF